MLNFVSYETDAIIRALEKTALDKEYQQKIKKLENPYGDSSAPNKVITAIESVDLNDRKWYVKQKLC